MAINTPDALDAELLVEIFQTDLINEALPNDIYDKQSGNVVYAGGKEPPQLPETMYMKLDAAADEGRSVKVPLLKDLFEDPTLGSLGDQRASEETPKTKYFQHYYTDISHATTNQSYGVLARDKIPYKIFEQRVPLLGRYFKQYLPVMRRQAAIEGVSENLEEAPHFLSTNICRNVYVPGATFANQPVYSITESDWIDELGTRMSAAGTGSTTYPTLELLQIIEEYLFDYFKMEPLEDSEGQYVIVTMPSPQMRYLRRTNSGANSAGGVMRDIAALGAIDGFKWPNHTIQIGRLRLIEDQNYATWTIGGSGSASGGAGYTLSTLYRRMGDADDGSSDPRDKSASARCISIAHGKRSLCEWTPEKFHWEWEYQQYDKDYGSGVFFSCGIKRVQWTQSSATASNIQCRGTALIPWPMVPTTAS